MPLSIVLNRREKIGSQILLQSSGLNNTGPENTWYIILQYKTLLWWQNEWKKQGEKIWNW